MANETTKRRVYSVLTPPIKGSGNRFGENIIVTDVNEEASRINGEQVEGHVRIDMEHGDLLLNIRPAGLAKDKAKLATLFAAVEGLHLLMSAPWPEAKPRLIRRIIAFRSSGARSPASPREATPPNVLVIERLRSAVQDAFDAGIVQGDIIKIVFEKSRVDQQAAIA